MKTTNILLAAAIASLTTNTWAAAFNETTDAGSTIASAVQVPGGATSITGSLSSTDKVDIFGFNWGGGGFFVNTSTTSWDTQLFLFDSAGHGLYANDDGGSFGFGLGSYLDAVLSAGQYFLAITEYNLDARNLANQLIFPSSPFGPIHTPSAADTTLDHWGGGSGSAGAYELIFRSSTGQEVQTGDGTVPEPSVIALMGLGFAGIRLSRRKVA